MYWIHLRFSFLFCMFVFVFCQRKSYLTQSVIKFNLGSSSPFHLTLNWYNHMSHHQRKWEFSYLVCMYLLFCEVIYLLSWMYQLLLPDNVWSPRWAYSYSGTPSRPHCYFETVDSLCLLTPLWHSWHLPTILPMLIIQPNMENQILVFAFEEITSLYEEI